MFNYSSDNYILKFNMFYPGNACYGSLHFTGSSLNDVWKIDVEISIFANIKEILLIKSYKKRN